MSVDKETPVIKLHQTESHIEVRPHPDDVIDVDPQILAVMEARLKGQSLKSVYGDEDKVSSEFLLRKEREKLARVFGAFEKVSMRFQSLRAIKEVREELKFEEVNDQWLSQYALKKSNGSFVDQCDLYASILGAPTLLTKAERMRQRRKQLKGMTELNELLSALSQQYASENFEPLKITKEVMQLNPFINSLVKENRAVDAMNELLPLFYGEPV